MARMSVAMSLIDVDRDAIGIVEPRRTLHDSSAGHGP